MEEKEIDFRKNLFQGWAEVKGSKFKEVAFYIPPFDNLKHFKVSKNPENPTIILKLRVEIIKCKEDSVCKLKPYTEIYITYNTNTGKIAYLDSFGNNGCRYITSEEHADLLKNNLLSAYYNIVLGKMGI